MGVVQRHRAKVFSLTAVQQMPNTLMALADLIEHVECERLLQRRRWRLGRFRNVLHANGLAGRFPLAAVIVLQRDDVASRVMHGDEMALVGTPERARE